MKLSPLSDAFEMVLSGALAGTVGGLAEILWIVVWSIFAGTDAAEVARGIGGVFISSTGPALGISIHMVLALALGIALVATWRSISARWHHAYNTYALAFATLAIVWLVNFFLILPIVSPAFVELIPLPISFASKLLFGVAAAATLQVRASAEITAIKI